MAETRLRYKGDSDRYELSSEDLKRHGVEGFTKVVFEAKNQFTVGVSPDAAEKMVELMPNDFELIEVSSEESIDGDDDSPDDGDDSLG